jgi:hypothetical protein
MGGANGTTGGAGDANAGMAGFGAQAGNVGTEGGVAGSPSDAASSDPNQPDGSDNDAGCDAGTNCDPTLSCDGGACLKANGDSCTDDDECSSDHCQNGFCCSGGDCCEVVADCGDYEQAAECDSVATCQGTRVDAVCDDSQCGEQVVDDDSACSGQEVDDCGDYPAVSCSAATSQTAPTCASSCSDNDECDAAAHCGDGDVCVADVGQGSDCDEAADCADGRPCVDGVCCNNVCGSICSACDLPGLVGTCSPIAPGQDPDNECGTVSCLGYYHSWNGDTCRRKADVPAPTAACNGSNACRSPAEECGATNTVGPDINTCHATCQNPNGATCTGTTAGVCTNVNPGVQSCGQGECENTVNQCQNGLPVTCNPLPSSTETCNYLDDDCDGTPDDGSFSDGYGSNGACGTTSQLGTVGSEGTTNYSNMNIYPLGDVDHYRATLQETDSTCGCTDLASTDEDYQVRVSLTAPTGVGSLQLCVNVDSCSFPVDNCIEVAAGNMGTFSMWVDGSCAPGGGNDSYTLYMRVLGDNAPSYECHAYTLSYVFDAGYCR